MSRTVRPAGPLAWLDVERAVESFERSYAEAGAAEPAAFCPPVGDPLRLPIAGELVRVDLEFAARDGRGRRLEDYRDTFPDLFEDAATLAEVAFEEYRLRRQAGEEVSPEDYWARFGIDASSWPDGGSIWPSTRRSWGLGPSADSAGASPRRGSFPEPGEEVLGFRLVRLLGRGAFARVYQAEQADLAGRHVALKLSTQLVAEAGTLARLQHTNIVPVYSVHRLGRLQAICMPYLGRVTLADVLHQLRGRPAMPAGGDELARVVSSRSERPGPPAPCPRPPGPEAAGAGPGPATAPPLEALRRKTHVEASLWIAAELADGLAHAHDRRVIHRDLKPANVLLSDEGRPMLLDFNLAGAASGDGEGGDFVGGTPSHMAPEQLDALLGAPEVIDGRSDVYALGLILFELLTGRSPFPLPSGRSVEEIRRLRQERAAPPPPARRWNPAVSPAVDAILARALAPDPAARYPDAHQLGEDLRLQLGHRPLRHVRDPSARERARKLLRRNAWVRSVPFVAGLVAVVAAVGLAGFTYRGRLLDRARADVTLAGFRRDAERARPLLLLPEPEARDLSRGLEIGRGALGWYGLAGPDRWDEESALRHRSPEDRASLKTELGELAFLMAGAEHRRADREPGEASSRTALESALRLNRIAGDLLANDPARGPHATLQRARLLDAAGRGDEARSLRDSAGPAVDYGQGLWLRVAELDRRRAFREALDLLRGSEPERGGSIGYWRSRAEHHAAVGEWPEAAAAFTTALALSPRPDADLLGRRGAARLAMREFQGARDDYDAALRLVPEDPALLRDRAQARLGLGDSNGALADLGLAGRLDPGHTRVHFMRSRILDRVGDRRAAAQDHEQGLSRTPGDELSWIARGLAHMAGDPGRAVADFDRALAENPESRQAMQNKASVLSERLGRTEEAIAVLDRLIGIHPEYVAARAGRGVLLARLGRRDAALSDASAALALSDEPFIRYQVAGIFALTSRSHPEDRAEALRLLASALRDKQGLAMLPTDPDLGPIRGDPDLDRLVEAARTLEAASLAPDH